MNDERLSPSDLRIARMLWESFHREILRRLMSGNDAQCFTTRQYEDARDEWIAKLCGATRQSLGLDRPPREVAKSQLRASTLVVEVSHDVWTTKALAEIGGEV